MIRSVVARGARRSQSGSGNSMPLGLAAKSAPPWAWPLGGSAFFPNEGLPGLGFWRGAAQRRFAPPVGCFSSQTSAPLNPMLFHWALPARQDVHIRRRPGSSPAWPAFRYPRARRGRLGPFRLWPHGALACGGFDCFLGRLFGLYSFSPFGRASGFFFAWRRPSFCSFAPQLSL